MQPEVVWCKAIVDLKHNFPNAEVGRSPYTSAYSFDRLHQSDTLRTAMQQKIQEAFQEDLVNKEASKLVRLEIALEQDQSVDDLLKNYWIAYINYLKTLVAQQQKDQVKAKEADEKGIAILEKNTTKSADDYALLALLKGLSFYFAQPGNEMNVYVEIEHLITSGVGLDKNNVRLQYVQAVLDFHTPKEYGGGSKTERFLLNAIEWPETNADNPQRPTWGKEEAYDLLIQYYLREDKKDKAKKYFDEGKFSFPTSYGILRHRGSF